MNKDLDNNKPKDFKNMNPLLPSSATAVGEVWAELVVVCRGERVSNLLQTPPTYTISLEDMGPRTSGPVNPRGCGTLSPGMTREQNGVKVSTKDSCLMHILCKIVPT